MTAIALVPEIIVHPVTSLGWRDGDTCGDCLHYNPSEYACGATRERRITAPNMTACTRYLPNGALGRVYRYGMTHPRVAASIPVGLAIGLVLMFLRFTVLA